MSERGYLNHFQGGRAGREKRLRPLFCDVINNIMKNFSFDVFKKVGPDYEVIKNQEVFAYFEAEFPTEGRWPIGGEFKYDTIRWPLRKWEQYCEAGDGLYNGKPLFMISIRDDLKDAYYIDALTWCNKSNVEHVRGSVFHGFPKTYKDFGKGLQGLEDYIVLRMQTVYGLKI